jgi:tetraacyldisaccharide 4'-kinase
MNLLTPFGTAYGCIIGVRNRLYDRGLLGSQSLGAKTVSIGNITAGGTGKTPLVALVAEMLAENDEKVCILTRGYGRENPKDRVLVSDGEKVLVGAKMGGDEPVELAHKLTGKAVVVADADRVAAAKWALEKFGITAFVLDDGFQHRRAKRDLDIVCIDATDPFGGGEVLPAGGLREPLANLRRADAIVITRSNLSWNIEDLRSEISDLNPAAAIFIADNSITRVLPLEEFHAKTQSSQSKLNRLASEIGWERLRAEGDPDNVDEEVRLIAFCALGNPDSFFFMLEDKFEEDPMDEFDLGIRKKFPDHHIYSQDDIDILEKQATECRIDAFLTTAKDAVKLKDLKFEIPCYVIEVEPVISDTEQFRKLITAS